MKSKLQKKSEPEETFEDGFEIPEEEIPSWLRELQEEPKTGTEDEAIDLDDFMKTVESTTTGLNLNNKGKVYNRSPMARW